MSVSIRALLGSIYNKFKLNQFMLGIDSVSSDESTFAVLSKKISTTDMAC
ncbi:MAG TPA: hypothetical protein VFT71_07105 [Candidatus Nitrosocosmicus sp.]|nr:hypothetical protein [Candidatus Nitrosocosmicus sp.]